MAANTTNRGQCIRVLLKIEACNVGGPHAVDHFAFKTDLIFLLKMLNSSSSVHSQLNSSSSIHSQLNSSQTNSKGLSLQESHSLHVSQADQIARLNYTCTHTQTILMMYACVEFWCIFKGRFPEVCIQAPTDWLCCLIS